MAAWGYFLYQGVVDPLGGINTLWPLFGIANQMLAAIALTLGAVVLFKMKRERYACRRAADAVAAGLHLTAGWQKIFAADPKVSFLAHAAKYNAAIAEGKVLAPAKSLEQMSRVVLNDYINAGLCAIFMFVVISTVTFGIRPRCAPAPRTARLRAKRRTNRCPAPRRPARLNLTEAACCFPT